MSLNPFRIGKNSARQIRSMARTNCLTQTDFDRLFTEMERALELAVELYDGLNAPVLDARRARPGGPFVVIDGGLSQ